jgi:hypothetical protein
MNLKRYLFGWLFCFATFAWAGDAARVVFVAGQALVSGQQVQVGSVVPEGARLQTGTDGYLYLETVDKGFFIMRPNTKAQIVAYQIDSQNLANSRMKLELESGVARHISGEAAKSARKNFRFNTPVAAIGLRGTDFTIYADQNATRITVLSGGVVVSALSGACVAEGFGPCEGASSRELFANLNNNARITQTLLVERGKTPVIVQGTEQAPDVVAPPRSNEPVATKTQVSAPVLPTASTEVLSKDQNLEVFKTNLVTGGTASSPVQLIWGRWQPLLDQKIEVDVNALQNKNQLIATNSFYALMRNRDSVWLPIGQSSVGFALQQSQAVITDDANKITVPAKLENGQLQVDFVASSFFTKFDLLSASQRFTLQNSGEVSSDGRLYGGNQSLRPNNMAVSGALAGDNRSASYLFQSRLDDGRLAVGATLWGK